MHATSMKHKQKLQKTNGPLLHGPDVDILPAGSAEKSNAVDTHSSDKHVLLCLTVAEVDGITSRASNRVAVLNLEAAVDTGKVWQGARRQVSCKASWEDTGPDGTCNGRADSASDGNDHRFHGEESREVLLLGHGHESSLLGGNQDTTAKSDEDHAHDNVANILVGLTELDHKTNAEHGKRYTEEERP
jgi:hypothetical protein